LRPILVILIVFGILVSELRFDWAEQLVGSFLVGTNTVRPESGSIWEVNRQTQTARRTLEQIITDRQSSQREARNAASFAEISAGLAPDQGVMLAPDQFRRLYLNLPDTIAQEIISPVELLKILSEDRFARAYFEKNGKDELQVYLLDGENRVLRRLAISADLLKLITQNGRATEGTLEEDPQFKDRIYPAEKFMNALNSLSEDSRRNVLPQPERLLAAGGRIARVGISDETVSGGIEVGYEIQTGASTKVVSMPGREWAVWQLRTLLEGKNPELPSYGEPNP